uniref:RING-type domain-containing protein n=1 Tax=Kalanchoe fedtschenkoi TaxID=63787 RepID=A0A7N0TC20_KALFE
MEESSHSSSSSPSPLVDYYYRLSFALRPKAIRVVLDSEKFKSCNFELLLTYHQETRIQIFPENLSTPPPTPIASSRQDIITPYTVSYRHYIPLRKIQSTRGTKKTVMTILRGCVRLKDEDLKRIVDSVESAKPLWEEESPVVVLVHVDLRDMSVAQLIMPKDALIRQKLTCPSVGGGGGGASTCAICLEEFSRRALVIKTRCGHAFHGSCIARWLIKSGTCPLCRAHLQNTQHSSGADVT